MYYIMYNLDSDWVSICTRVINQIQVEYIHEKERYIYILFIIYNTYITYIQTPIIILLFMLYIVSH